MSRGGAPGGPDEAARHDDTEPLPVVTPPEERGERASWWRWALLVALVALLALAAANAWLASTMEGRLAEEVERELGAPVDVQLEGFPVGFRSLTGRLPGAELHGREVPLPDTAATLTEVRLSLTDVRVDRDRDRLEAASARVEASLDETGVEELLGVLAQIPLVDIELRPGTLRLNVAGFAVADATVTADAGDLVFAFAAPLDQLVPGELRLDDLPLGLRVEDVVLREGELELHGRIAPLVIDA